MEKCFGADVAAGTRLVFFAEAEKRPSDITFCGLDGSPLSAEGISERAAVAFIYVRGTGGEPAKTFLMDRKYRAIAGNFLQDRNEAKVRFFAADEHNPPVEPVEIGRAHV
ncbi:MAG: hypothetical protein LBB14_02255 [Puniceicoccales bacterium]|nr:hypothetical protein [Puniceicoccales bacterium]